jgi:acyl-CoA reductase-like NAD-dependent aldehyde dehydrogenase
MTINVPTPKNLMYPDALFIDGRWARTSDGEEVINPATEAVIGVAPVGGAMEVEAAIAAARHAFDKGGWATMPARERRVKLQAFYDALMRRADDIKALITAEAGATAFVIKALQFTAAMQHAQYFIDICERDPVTPLPLDINPMPNGTKWLGAGVAVRHPIGVVSAITPFNFPFFLNTGKVFPALAAGCTVVLKPSPFTPFEALILGVAAEEAGLPPGVLNIVTGGPEVGMALTTDPRIDLITFTGSDAVGAAIQAQSAPTLKRCLLELGGKSALIVRADANLAAAAASAIVAFTQHAGQSCAATTRLLVHNSVRAEFAKVCTEQLAALKVGDPADPSVMMGPLIREKQRERVEAFVDVATQEGAKLLFGGKRPAGFDKGFFYEPTLYDDVKNNWRIAQEEVFGPISVIIGYDTDEEAVALANDSPFGLAGGIFSADVGRAYEMALQVQTGRFAINGGSGSMSSHHPFGGVKRSGYGREYGHEGLNEYTYLKAIAYHGG